MRELPGRTSGLAFAAAAALLVSGCGGGADEAGNTADPNLLDANLMLDQPGNDASALESAVNAPEPVVTDTGTGTGTGNQSSNSSDVVGTTSGGDTGGNSADTNVSGT